MNLSREWRAFLRLNPRERGIVARLMERTGYTEDEVLIYLIAAWAAQNLTQAWQDEGDELFGAPKSLH